MTRVENNLTPLTYLSLIRLVNPLIRVYKVNSLYSCSRVNHTFRQSLTLTLTLTCSSGCRWLSNGETQSPSTALSPPSKHWLLYLLSLRYFFLGEFSTDWWKNNNDSEGGSLKTRARLERPALCTKGSQFWCSASAWQFAGYRLHRLMIVPNFVFSSQFLNSVRITCTEGQTSTARTIIIRMRIKIAPQGSQRHLHRSFWLRRWKPCHHWADQTDNCSMSIELASRQTSRQSTAWSTSSDARTQWQTVSTWHQVIFNNNNSYSLVNHCQQVVNRLTDNLPVFHNTVRAFMNSISDTSEHSEESDIHLLTNSDHYRARSETMLRLLRARSKCSGSRLQAYRSLSGNYFVYMRQNGGYQTTFYFWRVWGCVYLHSKRQLKCDWIREDDRERMRDWLLDNHGLDMHHLTCGLWNQQLPSSSFHQPHSVHCPPGPPHPAHITS